FRRVLFRSHDGEIPFQTARMARYREQVQKLLDAGRAYHCYCSAEEVEAMREAQRARGEKPRYDGTWRPMPGKTLPDPPAGVDPVVRFANPLDGETVIHDLVKGDITVANSELDDLIIARADGTPTYNFCVVVDDMDMGITHVIRGDDHVNNTPRAGPTTRTTRRPRATSSGHWSMLTRLCRPTATCR